MFSAFMREGNVNGLNAKAFKAAKQRRRDFTSPRRQGDFAQAEDVALSTTGSMQAEELPYESCR